MTSFFHAVIGTAASLLVAASCFDAAQAQERAAPAVIDPRVAAAASPERLALLRDAEAALARGQAVAAIGSLDRAALMLHAADTEMGLVRAYLQLGEYRRALSFAAHTAGAHRDTPAAAALYAWLLAAGGQPAFATRMLDEAQQRAPDDASLREMRHRLRTAPAAGVAAPYAVMAAGDAVPAHARVAGSGVLLDEERAVVPLALIGDGRALWVRNGIGQTTPARVERRIDDLGVALLRLAGPLDDPRLQLAPRDPFAGSPGFVVAYAPSADAAAAWPWLHQGFFGQAHRQVLGIDVPGGANGGLVLDAAGRWSGIALEGRWLPASRLRDLAGDVLPATSEARIAPDEAYERALRVAVQVLVAP